MLRVAFNSRAYHADLGLNPNAIAVMEQGKQGELLNLWKA